MLFCLRCFLSSFQEKRMSKATEVMMQYVENLKRTYEKDHAELMEYKKLASQNSSRSYGSPGKTINLLDILQHICSVVGFVVEYSQIYVDTKTDYEVIW